MLIKITCFWLMLLEMSTQAQEQYVYNLPIVTDIRIEHGPVWVVYVYWKRQCLSDQMYECVLHFN